MAKVELNKICKSFGKARVVTDVDLSLEKGEFVVFVGPSGCGKSTLLRMIAGLEDITSGKLRIGGEDMTEALPAARGVSMVFQSYALYPHMTVRENMSFGLEQAKLARSEIAARVEDAARMLKIGDLLERKPRALSGGQRQRVAIGRAITRKPRVFLFDEPLSNLDAALRGETRVEIARLHARLAGTTMIYVTHDQVEAMTLGDRVAVLRAVSEGRPYNLQQIGPPSELFRSPDNLFVAGFIGSPPMNLMYGRLESEGDRVFAVLPTARIEVDKRALEDHPGIENRMNEELVIGLRPSSLEAAAVAGDNPDRSITVTVDVTEMLGADTFVHSTLNQRPVVTPDIEELLADTGQSAESLGDVTNFIARVSPDINVSHGDQVKLVVDTTKIHFFDQQTGNRVGTKPMEPATA